MHISSFTLKFTYLTSCCRYQPFKPHLFECIRTAALDSQTSCSGGSWSFCLHLRSQEPATTLSRMLRLDSKAGLQLCTQTEVYLHTSDIMYIYTVIGKRGSRGRSGAVQSNTMTTLTHTLSGQVQGGVNKEMEKGVNRAQRTMGKYTSESAGVTNPGKYNTPARNSAPTRP